MEHKNTSGGRQEKMKENKAAVNMSVYTLLSRNLNHLVHYARFGMWLPQFGMSCDQTITVKIEILELLEVYPEVLAVQ